MSPPVKTFLRRFGLTVLLTSILALFLGSVGPAQAAQAPHTLGSGQSLATGGNLQSPDGRYTLDHADRRQTWSCIKAAIRPLGERHHRPSGHRGADADGWQSRALRAGHVPIWSSSTAGTLAPTSNCRTMEMR